MQLRKFSLCNLLAIVISATILLACRPSFAEDNIYAKESCSNVTFNLRIWNSFPSTSSHLSNIFEYLAIVNFSEDGKLSYESKAVMAYFNVSPETINGVQVEKSPSKGKIIAYYRPLINAINNTPNYFRDDLGNKKYDVYNFVEIYSFIGLLPGYYRCFSGINNQLNKLGSEDKIKLSLINEQFRKYSSDYLKNHENEIAAYSDNIANSDKLSVKNAFTADKITTLMLNDSTKGFQLFGDNFRKNPELSNKILNAYNHTQQVITQINSLSDNGQKCMVADNDEAYIGSYRYASSKSANDIYQKLIPTNGINMNFVALFDVDAKGAPYNITFQPKVEGKYFEGRDSDARNNIAVMTEYVNAFNYVPGLKDCKPHAAKGKMTFHFRE